MQFPRVMTVPLYGIIQKQYGTCAVATLESPKQPRSADLCHCNTAPSVVTFLKKDLIWVLRWKILCQSRFPQSGVDEPSRLR